MSLRTIAIAALLALVALAASSAHAQDPRYGNGPGGPGYGNGPGDAVECRSNNYAFRRCPVPWRNVRMVRQLSDTQCVRGMNWGVDRSGIWVDRGCAGRFIAADGGGRPGGGWRPGPDWNQRFSVTCESQDGRDRFCQVDAGGGGRVYLERQLSNTACIEGRNWRWNRAGVWVTQGCRGVFTIDRRW